MTDEEALARFPRAVSFWEIPDPSMPLGAFAVVLFTNGSRWAFDKSPPRPILKSEMDERKAHSCKPSDAAELVPPGAEIWPKPARNSLEDFSDMVKNLKPGEWQEHWRRSDEAEDKALGRTGPSTSTFLETDSPQNLPELTDELRSGLRQRPEWMICFHLWLNSVQPSEAREWLAAPKEELLRHLDSLTWRVLSVVSDTNQTPDDLAEALWENLPMWEETASEEEIDAEEKNPLTQEETDQLREIANEAHCQP